MKSNKETIINKYFIDKLKATDIANELSISKSAVTYRCYRKTKDMNEKK